VLINNCTKDSKGTDRTVSSAEEFDVAMGLWDEGDFGGAAQILRRTVYDTAAVGINSVHYLAGCTGEMEHGDYSALRQFLTTVAGEHQDARVAKVAWRFATNCLTQQREYEDAMAEYDGMRANTECLEDSVLAVIDYLAVEGNST
jgi:hypothetical protein